MGWEIVIRFYKELRTWMFTLRRKNEDGSFKHSQYNKGTPSGITNPGYTEKWKEAVIKDHGDVIRVR